MTTPILNRISLGRARDLTRDSLGGAFTEIQANDSRAPIG